MAASGQKIYVFSGTYDYGSTSLTLTGAKSGLSIIGEDPTTTIITSSNSAGTIVLNGALQNRISGFTILNTYSSTKYGIATSGGVNNLITVDNCIFSGESYGIYAASYWFTNSVFTKNKFTNIATYGFNLNGGSNNVISNNTFDTITTSAIYGYNEANLSIFNNLLVNAGNTSGAINITYGKVSIKNNTVINSGIGMYLSSITSLAIVNNIIAYSSSKGMTVSSSTITQSGYNTFWANITSDTTGYTFADGDVNRDPLLTSYYRLGSVATGQAADSPEINSGTGTSASLGLGGMTTVLSNSLDANIVDRGYHADSTTVATTNLYYVAVS